MTWQKNTGRAPRTGDTPLKVKFRDGTTSKTSLPAAKWNWANRSFEFDIVAYEKEEK